MRSPSGWRSRKSSGGCWPSAASISIMLRGSCSRGCATSCPIPRICATWRPPPRGSSVPSAIARRSPFSGDYDVDGATSAALLARFFAAVGARTRIYVPDRLREGYGPNSAALLRLRDEGARVVVTVDCGTTAHLPLADAAESGLDVIVVDHHVAEPLLPRAAAVLNPNRLDEDSPHGSLAAVGVAFLLVVAVNRALRLAGWYGAERTEPDLLGWLDLVALGTVCDVVPLDRIEPGTGCAGDQGGTARRQSRHGGAGRDCRESREPLDAYHLGFVLGPRVNAGGRVGAADLGARLLATDDPRLGRRTGRAPRRLQP